MARSLSQRLAHILDRSLTPLLRSRGFHKEVSAYLAEKGEVTWVVDVQTSRWNDKVEAKFTINGGIYIPKVVSVYSRRTDPETLKIADCCLSVRIGMLHDSRLDKWWGVAAHDDSAQPRDDLIAAELCDWVESLLLPFLAGFGSRAEVAEFLEAPIDPATRLVMPRAPAQRHAYAAIIYARMGNLDKARRAIERAVRDAENSPIQEFVEQLREHISSL